MRFLLIAVTLLLMLVPFESASAAGHAGNGKAAFVKHGCWQCHGFMGQGGMSGPKLAPAPMPYESFSAYVRDTNRSMPP